MVNLQHILMHKIFVITGIAALSLSASTAHARYVTTTCDGKVGWHPLSAYTAITKGYGTPEAKDECIFVTRSKIGRKILKVCPKDSQCSVEADVQAGDEYEITSVRAINRIGTPSLDAIAAREKAAREKRRWASVFPYMEKAKNCVVANLTGEVSASSVSDILLGDGTCSQQGNALYSEFSRQFSHSGHYKFMDYYYDLAEIVSKLRNRHCG
jgi:hypothetical protein